MKRILILFLALWAVSAKAQFTFVQSAWNSSAGGAPATTTLSLPSVGAGHLVVVSICYLGSTTGWTMSSLTDGNGHNFTFSPNSPWQWNSAARYVWLAYMLSAPSGTMTITATPSIAHGISIHAIEFSYTGVASFDKDANAAPVSGTTPANTPSITPTNSGSLLYAAGVADPNTQAGTFSGVGGSWTKGTGGSVASDANDSWDEYILSASGATSVNFTITGSANSGWNASAMAFFTNGSTVSDFNKERKLEQIDPS